VHFWEPGSGWSFCADPTTFDKPPVILHPTSTGRRLVHPGLRKLCRHEVWNKSSTRRRQAVSTACSESRAGFLPSSSTDFLAALAHWGRRALASTSVARERFESVPPFSASNPYRSPLSRQPRRRIHSPCLSQRYNQNQAKQCPLGSEWHRLLDCATKNHRRGRTLVLDVPRRFSIINEVRLQRDLVLVGAAGFSIAERYRFCPAVQTLSVHWDLS